MIRARRSQLLLLALIVGGLTFLSIATGFDARQKAWFDANPPAAIGIRIAVILILVGGGVAYLTEPGHTVDGSAPRLSRLWALIAFAMAGAQLAVLLFGNPFN